MKKKIKPLKDFLGIAYSGFKGQKAVEKLILEKQGHTPNAFHREDIGYITLVWGDEGSGLCHLIKQREKQGIDIEEFISDLSELVENGEIYPNKYFFSRVDIWRNGKIVTVETVYNGKSFNWILTAFKQHNKPKTKGKN